MEHISLCGNQLSVDDADHGNLEEAPIIKV